MMMKRAFSVLLSAFLCLSVTQAADLSAEKAAMAAAAGDTGATGAAQTTAQPGSLTMEDAILLARGRVHIPDDATFDYYVDTGSAGAFYTVYHFNWSFTENDRTRNVSVGVSDTGFVVSFSQYDSDSDYDVYKTLPKVSYDAALSTAQAFAGRMLPDGFTDYRLAQGDTASIQSSYSFTYQGYASGLPVSDAQICVYVDGESGLVTSYSASPVRRDVAYPEQSGLIGAQGAADAYKALAKIKLCYVRSYSTDENGESVSVVRPVYQLGSLNIDAVTGKELQLYTGAGVGGGMGGGAYATAQKAAGGENRSDTALSPAERAAVTGMAKYMKQDRAEQAARALPYAGLDDSYKLQSANLQKNWSTDDYAWSLSFVKPGTSPKDSLYTYVTLDAASGYALDLSTSYDYDLEAPAKLPDYAAAKAAAQEALSKLCPDIMSKLTLEESEDEDIAGQRSVYFYFNRTENGIPFSANGVSVSYDRYTSKIMSFSRQWESGLNFPSVAAAVGQSKAADVALSHSALTLCYMPVSDETGASAGYKLAYAFLGGFEGTVDALTGKVVGYDGQALTDGASGYSDISGSWAKSEIEALYAIGVKLDGAAFNPESAISEKDFLYLLSCAKQSFYIPYPASAEGLSSFNKALIASGLMKPGDTASADPIRLIDAAGAALDFFGYGPAAKLADIYKGSFDGVAADRVGYAAIAQGIGLLHGGADFGGTLTRAEAAHMIYTLLAVR